MIPTGIGNYSHFGISCSLLTSEQRLLKTSMPPPTHIAVQYTNGTDFSYQIINLNDPADIAAEGTGSTLPATWDNAQEDDFSIRWSSQTNGGVYLVNDLVNYNGVLYKNITGTNSDTTPDADITNWELTYSLP